MERFTASRNAYCVFHARHRPQRCMLRALRHSGCDGAAAVRHRQFAAAATCCPCRTDAAGASGVLIPRASPATISSRHHRRPPRRSPKARISMGVVPQAVITAADAVQCAADAQECAARGSTAPRRAPTTHRVMDAPTWPRRCSDLLQMSVDAPVTQPMPGSSGIGARPVARAAARTDFRQRLTAAWNRDPSPRVVTSPHGRAGGTHGRVPPRSAAGSPPLPRHAFSGRARRS